MSVPQNTSERNKLPARFPGHIVRINKQTALQTVDGGPFQRKASSEDEIIASSFRLITTFLRHAPDSQLFQEDIFEQLRCFLNSLDLSVCEDQAIGTSTQMATRTESPFANAVVNPCPLMSSK